MQKSYIGSADIDRHFTQYLRYINFSQRYTDGTLPDGKKNKDSM